MDEEQKQAQLILSLNLTNITSNIKNCYKRGTFNDKSIANFKRNNETAYEFMIKNIVKEGEDVPDKIDPNIWINKISELINNQNDEAIKALHEETLKTIENKQKKIEQALNWEDVELNGALTYAFLHIKKDCVEKGFDRISFDKFTKDKQKEFDIIQKKSNEEIITSHQFLSSIILLAESSTWESVRELQEEAVEVLHQAKLKKQSKDAIKFSKTGQTHQEDQQDSSSELENDNELVNKQQSRNRYDPSFNEAMMRQMFQGFEILAHSNRSNKQLRLETLKNDSQDIQEWFSKYERQTTQWSDEERGHDVPAWFEDSALRFWELMNTSDRYNYENIKKTLIRKFRADDYVYKSMTKFYGMRQDVNEKVETFMYRLCKCKREWPTTDHSRFDRDLPHIFKNGLKPDIAAHITSYNFKDIDDLSKKAKAIENILLKKEESKSIENAEISMENEISSKSRDVKCFKCKKIGHFAKECVTKEEIQKKSCLYCGRDNHLAIDCIFMKKQFEILKNKTKESPKTYNNRKYCKNCDMKNHNTQDCRKSKYSGNKKEVKPEENKDEKEKSLN